MKRKIIYVFGPKRLYEKYMENGKMVLEEGGWLKIGETTSHNEEETKWVAAHRRVADEPRTGIPEVSRLYDVFEFPYKQGKVDDRIRDILSGDIYTLETSKIHNRGTEDFEIKAGTEFVYGVKRNQVLNAIYKYEHGLLLDDSSEELREMIKRNHIDESPYDVVERLNENISNENTNQINDWNEKIFDEIIKRCENLNIKMTHYLGKRYCCISSPQHPLGYVLSYSSRYNKLIVAFETFNGELGREAVESLLSKTTLDKQFSIERKQGSKDKNKWSWLISDSMDKSDNEIIDWIVKTFRIVFSEIESVK